MPAPSAVHDAAIGHAVLTRVLGASPRLGAAVQGAELAVGVTRLALLWLTASSDLLLLPALAWRPASPRTWINVTHLAALHATALVRARPPATERAVLTPAFPVWGKR